MFGLLIITPICLAVILYVRRKKFAGKTLLIVSSSVVALMGIITTIPLILGFTLMCWFWGFERTVNLLFPPDDIGVPLASIQLSEMSTNYSLTFQNKYPGNHSFSIMIPSPKQRLDGETERMILGMKCKVFDGDTLIYEEVFNTGKPLWGIDRIYGFSYWHYKVPQDLPRSVPLRMEVSLLGDIAEFLEENKGAKLFIQKWSDE